MVLLYVDDDLEDVDLFCEAVKTVHESCVCLVARNGKDGLRMLRSILPDYVFLDINMPVMGGKETLAAIKADESLRNIPVCMLSTSSNASEIKMYKEMGAHRFFVKPSSFSELCAILKDFLIHPALK